jgi:hypothetical protein
VVSIDRPLIIFNISDDFIKIFKGPRPFKMRNVFERLNNSFRGVTESRGIRRLKLNRGAPYSWIFHNARVGRIKIRLNLWSVFLKISRIFLQHFPVSLLRSSSTCYTERRKTKPT